MLRGCGSPVIAAAKRLLRVSRGGLYAGGQGYLLGASKGLEAQGRFRRLPEWPAKRALRRVGPSHPQSRTGAGGRRMIEENSHSGRIRGPITGDAPTVRR